MSVLLIVAALAVWIAASALLAVVIGRAAHIADTKHEDELFARSIGRGEWSMRERSTMNGEVNQ